MGKGSKSPKTPDYSPVIDIWKDLAAWGKQNSTEMMTWAKKVYGENKNITDKVVNNALDWMTTQTGWSKEDRERYKNVFQPLEDALVKEAQSYASPERRAAEAAKAQADVATQFEAARKTAADNLEQYGVDPSQIRSQDLGTRIAEGAAKAGAGNQASWHVDDIARALRSEALGIGKDTAGRSASEASAAQSAGNAAANTTLAQTASGAATMGTPQSWAGVQSGAAQGWGSMLSQDYQDRMAKYEADQKQSSGWGSILGTLAGTVLGGPVGGALGGAVGKFTGFAEGGAIPDGSPQMFANGGGAIPMEASPSNGAITDDVPAQIAGGPPAQLNAGEFVMPKDVVKWLGEKGMQQLILKSRKEMTGQNGERPAQPEQGPPGGIPPGTPPEGIGAIPMPAPMPAG